MSYDYREPVHVRGVNEHGHKELFDNFLGQFVACDGNGRYVVSDGTSLWHVHPTQVRKVDHDPQPGMIP